MKIALLCPTKGRASLAKKMFESVLNTADSNNIVLYLCYDKIELASYHKEFNQYSPDLVKYVENCSVGQGVVWLHNLLADVAIKDDKNCLFYVVSDDVEFKTKGWDKALLDVYNSLENRVHVFGLQDSRDVDGTPHPIITREYLKVMGYLFAPIFTHFFVDTWLSEMAKSNGCFTYLRNYVLEHNKQNDETAYNIRANGKYERDVFVNERCQHFLALEKQRLKTAIDNYKRLNGSFVFVEEMGI